MPDPQPAPTSRMAAVDRDALRIARKGLVAAVSSGLLTEVGPAALVALDRAIFDAAAEPATDDTFQFTEERSSGTCGMCGGPFPRAEPATDDTVTVPRWAAERAAECLHFLHMSPKDPNNVGPSRDALRAALAAPTTKEAGDA